MVNGRRPWSRASYNNQSTSIPARRKIERETDLVELVLTPIRTAHNPSRSITDAEIDYLPRNHELIETLHNLLNGGCEIPPVEIQLWHSKLAYSHTKTTTAM